jgi:hypothetical protein
MSSCACHVGQEQHKLANTLADNSNASSCCHCKWYAVLTPILNAAAAAAGGSSVGD